MLIVVKDRNLHPGFQPLLDLEAFRTLDVLEIDAAEGRLQSSHGLHHTLDGVGCDLDVEYVDAGEFLEQNRLAFHHGFRRQWADVAETKDGRAVGHDSNKVGTARQRRGFGRIGGDLLAGGGDARRVGQRKVALVGERLGGLNLHFARTRKTMIGECC